MYYLHVTNYHRGHLAKNTFKNSQSISHKTIDSLKNSIKYWKKYINNLEAIPIFLLRVYPNVIFLIYWIWYWLSHENSVKLHRSHKLNKLPKGSKAEIVICNFQILHLPVSLFLHFLLDDECDIFYYLLKLILIKKLFYPHRDIIFHVNKFWEVEQWNSFPFLLFLVIIFMNFVYLNIFRCLNLFLLRNVMQDRGTEFNLFCLSFCWL